MLNMQMMNDGIIFRVVDVIYRCMLMIFFFKQKTAYEMRISDWSSDVGSSDLMEHFIRGDAMLGPRKMGYDRPSAGCDQDFAGGDRLARAEQHLMRPGDGRPLVDDLDLIVAERLGVETFEPRDLGEHIVAQRRPHGRAQGGAREGPDGLN